MPPPHVGSKDLLQRMYRCFTAHQKLYEESGVLGDITLRALSLEATHLGADTVDATPEGASPINLDTPLQNTTPFKSLRHFYSPNTPSTLQDHLETFYYIILYSAFRHSQHTGASSVTKILTYVREKYLEKKFSVITRGSDGLSTLIANEARCAYWNLGVPLREGSIYMTTK
ncbi:hypothetical protein BJ912DRAFT_1143754 [Pholiota molesta]|nr:hypothetical protein BJ912DRAFT_1143754 [Pholiota molesta]